MQPETNTMLTAGARRVGVMSKQVLPGSAVVDQPHPLDPLSPSEILAASKACRDYALALDLPPLRYSSIGAKEPNKHEVLCYLRGEGPRPKRLAMCILTAPPKNAVIEALVDLDAPVPKLLSWKEMDGVQPALTIDDCVDSERQIKANPEFQQYMKERYGITNMDEVACDPWYSGYRYGHPDGRIMQFILYQRTSPADNFYAHPLDTVVFYDMNTDTIKEFACYGDKEGQQVPLRDYQFHRTLLDRPFRPQKPLEVVMPEGPAFAVDGNTVTWSNWSFHVGYSWREGLILYNLAYADGGKVRPIMYRAALAEIIVPYGEPRSPYQYKCAYDVADYGLGFCANSLELGCDCLGVIKYFDAILNDAKGGVAVIKKAVCMKEEDAGMAWVHLEYRNGDREVRRMRRLAISFIATIANYEYAFYWYLYQAGHPHSMHSSMDGTIQFEAKLTGIVSTSPLYPEEAAAGGQPTNGSIIAPGVVAHHHQHFFCIRMDMALDDPDGGKSLSVVELDAEPMPLGPQNAHGIGFVTKATVLETEQQAQRMADPVKSRAWKIINPKVLHPASKQPVGWKLIPSTISPPMLAHPTSVHATRGAFATKHLWVTPYDENEMNPAGDYPLHPDPEQNQGIAQWTAKNRKVSDADCVVWYNVGLTHIVRPEDFPIMPVELIGFHLKPAGFFEVNPGVDLPPIRSNLARETITGAAKGDTVPPSDCCATKAAPTAAAGPLSKL
ncbi:hypothetical protein N2152v2_005840 [Parachlorella kessleri]